MLRLLTVVTFFHACIHQTLQAACLGPRKSALNPFLLTLKKDGAKLFSKIRTLRLKENNRCAYEWKEFGTCCDYDSLINYVKADRQRIEVAVNQTIESMTNASRGIALIYGISTGYSTYQLKGLPIRETIFKETLESSAEIGKNFRKSVISIFNEPSAFAASITRCWNKMTAVRAGSLCSTCSGRSNRFFEKDRAILSEEVCTDVLAECQDYFKLTVDFLSGVGSISSELLRRTDLSDKTNDVHELTSNLQRIFHAIEQSGIKWALRQFLKSEGATKNHFGDLLCSRLLNLVHQTIIQLLAKEFSRIAFNLPYYANRMFYQFERQFKIQRKAKALPATVKMVMFDFGIDALTKVDLALAASEADRNSPLSNPRRSLSEVRPEDHADSKLEHDRFLPTSTEPPARPPTWELAAPHSRPEPTQSKSESGQHQADTQPQRPTTRSNPDASEVGALPEPVSPDSGQAEEAEQSNWRQATRFCIDGDVYICESTHCLFSIDEQFLNKDYLQINPSFP